MKAVYPGSFDPLTFGHIDIIERIAKLFDEVHVVIAINVNKQYVFSHEKRVEMVMKSVKHLKNVVVQPTDKLIVQYARENNIGVVIRGLRAVSDFEYEMGIATANTFLDSEIETVFLMSKPNHMFMSSSQAREIAKFGGDFSAFVPKHVEDELRKYYAR